MQKRVLLLLLMLTVGIMLPNLACSEGLTFIVNAPQLAWGQTSPILARETAVVWVNVTSTFPVVNVTLRYISNRGEDYPSARPDQYHIIPMNMVYGNKHNGTYEAIMPAVENNTLVWGFAKAFDDHGNQAECPTQSIYYAMTPNPASSRLDLTLYVRHVDPKTMGMVMTVYGSLVNARSYSPELLPVSYYAYIEMTVPVGKYTYMNRLRTVDIFYSAGHPELYPFDGYDYTFRIFLPKYLNESGVWLGGDSLKPYVVYTDSVPEVPETQAERLDNSAWDMSSEVQFVPSGNFSLSMPYLRVTILLERRAEQVNYSILYPVMALYALLGCSVLLRGRDGLRNRLLLYLNVFVFSYGFSSSVRNLSITPLTFGYSMIDRIVLALVPCAVILAVLSIFSEVRIDTESDQTSSTRKSVKSFLDAVGIFGSGYVTYQISLITLKEYVSGGMISRTYSALDMGTYGMLIFVFLFMGIAVWLVLVTVSRFRSRFFLDHRTDD